MTVGAEGIAKNGRAEKAGGEVAELADVGGEAVGGLGALGFGKEVESQGEGVGGLRVGSEPVVRRDEFLTEGGENFLFEVVVFARVFRITQDCRGFGEKLGGVGEVGGLNEVLIGGGAGIIGARGGEGQ